MLVNNPAPYRVPVYDRMARELGDGFRAIYMTKRESNRAWDVPALGHDHVYLRGRAVPLGERDLHLRHGAIRELVRFRPDVVMTGGFHPPMLAAWAYAQTKRRVHVALSDGWIASEKGLSAAHRAARHVVYRRSHAYVGASEKTLQLFEAYGARRNLFVAPLGVDNAAFARCARPTAERRFDLMFAGNLIARKLPLFFAEVATRVAERRSIEVLVVGDGPLRDQLARRFSNAGVRATFTGFLQQSELPAMYGNARLLCFPTLNDPWGVVANEASAAATPVVTCANAGCAGELVTHEQTGLVLPLDAAEWTMRIVGLLRDDAALRVLGEAAQRRVAGYSFDTAADAMLASCRAAVASA